ncbi:hypothetical protein OG21DRAFT_1491955 [Imleria badia]|nr:hypothetical protein OG21DRAFT_1491955 [Imleria badia]
MSLLARFRLEQAARHNRHEGTPPRSRSRSPSPACSHASGLYFPSSPNSPHAPDSPGYPPAQSRRQECSASSENLEAECQLKRKKRFVVDPCRENQLDDDAMDQFAALDVPQMLIVLNGKLLALECERICDEALTFIHSRGFKGILNDRLRTCLLSPNLSKYVDGLPEHLWGFIKRNPGVFKLPAKALEDPELSIIVDSLIKEVLTSQRSQIKIKLASSVNKQQHISQLARALAQKDFIDVTTGQWARIAFLRQNFLLFMKLVTESTARRMRSSNLEPEQDDDDRDSLDSGNNNRAAARHGREERFWIDSQFWEFIDTLLDELRSELEGHPPELRTKEWEKNFTEVLQSDLQMFPASDRTSCLRASDGHNIVDWQRSLHQELVWL